MMSAAEMRRILRTEYGIKSEAEFDEAVRKSNGICIGIFTSPVRRGTEDEKKKSKEACS